MQKTLFQIGVNLLLPVTQVQKLCIVPISLCFIGASGLLDHLRHIGVHEAAGGVDFAEHSIRFRRVALHVFHQCVPRVDLVQVIYKLFQRYDLT